MPRKLGDVFFNVYPDTSGFRPSLASKLKALMTGVKADVPIGADTARLDAQIAAAKAKIAALKAATSTVQLAANAAKLDAQIAASMAKIADLRAAGSDIQLNADNKDLLAKIAATKSSIANLEAQASDLKFDWDTKAAEAKIAALQLQMVQLGGYLEELKKNPIGLDANIRAASTQILALDAQIKYLKSTAADIAFGANLDKLFAQIDAGYARIAALQDQAKNIALGANKDKLDAAIAAEMAKIAALQSEAQKISMSANTDKLTAQLVSAEANLAALGKAGANAGNQAWGPWFGLWGLLNRKFQLFGGAFGTTGILATVGAVHLLIDSVAEVAAVVIPAGVALGAFGIAAIPTIDDISKKMNAVYTTSKALNTAVYPLTNNLKSMADAVQPEVYRLFGDALYVVGQNTGGFIKLAKQAGDQLDKLGARAAAALTSGGFAQLLQDGPKFIGEIGDIIGNIFGTIGNLLKSVPQYAAIMLSALDGLTKGLEAVTASPITQWIATILLAGHGFLIWAGLASTAAVKLGGLILGLAQKMGLLTGVTLAFDGAAFVGGIATVLVSIGELIVALVTMQGTEAVTAAATGALGGALDALFAVNPLVWVGAAVAGLVALTLWLSHSTSATNDYNTAVKNTLGNTPVDARGVQLVAQMANTTKLAASAQDTLNNTQKTAVTGYGRFGQTITGVTGAYQQQSAIVDGYKGELQTLQTYQTNYNTLLKAAGGNLSFLNQAGITSNDIINASSGQMKTYVIEVKAAADAQQALGLGVGRAAAAQNAQTGDFITETLPAMQKVTQAENNLLDVVLGGRTAFDSFQQSIIGTTAKFVSPTGLADAAKLAGGNLTGINAQSLAFANTLYGVSIPALQKTISSLQEQQISTKDLTNVVATGAGEILQYTGNNKEANSVIVAMINNALGPGTVSLQSLNKWVKNNSTSLDGMNAIVAESTIKVGTLANVLQNNLTVQFQNSLLKASGAQTAIDNMTKAIVSQGTNSDAFRTARDQLITDLEKTGMNATDAKTYVDNLQKSIDAMHGKTVTVGVTVSAAGKAAATALVAGEAALHSSITFQTQGAAQGGQITGGTPGKDSVLGMLMPGEVVVPTSMVKAGAVDHLRGKLPGFAAGGAVGSLDAVPTWAQNTDAAWAAQVAINWAQAADKQFQDAAKAAAASAYSGPASFGGGFESLAALTSYARYFMQNGLSAAAAAGMAGTISGEQNSLGPESVGSGGFGLIGWTGNTLGLPAGYTGPTGNVANDLAIQLAGVIGYMKANGGAGPLNAAAASGGPVAAGNLWSSDYERPLVRYSDTRPAVAQEVYAALTGAATQTGTGVPLPSTKQLAAGGLIRAYASGGLVTGQNAELSAFAAVRSAVTSGLARPNAFFTSHKKSLASELATLTKRQAAEQSAYGLLSGIGLTRSNLSKFATRARDEITTAHDKYLSAAVPRPDQTLAAALQAVAAAAGSTGLPLPPKATSGGSTGGSKGGSAGGSGGGSTGGLTPAILSSLEMAEQASFGGLAAILGASLANPSGWLKSNRVSVTDELGTLRKRQQAQVAAYAALAGKGFTKANLSKFASATRAEISTAGDKGLNTASPAAMQALAQALAVVDAAARGGTSAGGSTGGSTGGGGSISSTGGGGGSSGGGVTARTSPLTHAQYLADLAEVHGLSLATIRKSPHLSHVWHMLHLQHLYDIGMAKGGMVFDRGGTLAPGANLVFNRTGAPEHLVPTGAPASGRKLSPDAQAIVDALERNTSAVLSQGTAFASQLNSTASGAAYRGSYSTRR